MRLHKALANMLLCSLLFSSFALGQVLRERVVPVLGRGTLVASSSLYFGSSTTMIGGSPIADGMLVSDAMLFSDIAMSLSNVLMQTATIRQEWSKVGLAGYENKARRFTITASALYLYGRGRKNSVVKPRLHKLQYFRRRSILDFRSLIRQITQRVSSLG